MALILCTLIAQTQYYGLSGVSSFSLRAIAMAQQALCPQGLSYSTTDPKAVNCLHDAFVAILTYGVDPSPHLQKALELDPNFVMAHVCRVRTCNRREHAINSPLLPDVSSSNRWQPRYRPKR